MKKYVEPKSELIVASDVIATSLDILGDENASNGGGAKYSFKDW